MSHRPEFSDIKSYDEFIKYYWYQKELVLICKWLKISHSGTKQELNHNIQEYFVGNKILSKPKHLITANKTIKDISLSSVLLDCGFCFNQKFREFFSKHTGVANFKFKADMVATWRRVKQELDYDFTIQDMLDVYHGKSDYAKYDNSTCEWNRFLKDFCADEENKKFKSRLYVAAKLWKIVRESSMPKVYSRDLVGKYIDGL